MTLKKIKSSRETRGFPGDSDGKESTCNAGDPGSIPELGRSPRGGHGNPLQYSYLENLHGQRSLAGCTPWGHKELDMTEQLSIAQRQERVTKKGGESNNSKLLKYQDHDKDNKALKDS